MELFVVNRHDEEESKDENKAEESSKLNRVLKKIEKNKKLRNKQKEKEQKIKEAIQRTTQARQIKREIKQNIVKVPENNIDEFVDKELIDKHIDEYKDQVTDNKHKENKGKKRKSEPVDIEGFTILGVDNFQKKAKVKRVLPRWLTNPTIISVNLQKLETKVSDLKIIDKQLRSLLKVNGVDKFFPVQAKVIPWLIQNNKYSDIMFTRDVCVSAPTGSGKTLSFVLPIVQMLKKYTFKKIRALVILPTQDLARQVFGTFKTYTEGTNIDVCIISGQNSFEVEQKQILTKNEAWGYISKIDILVCTAGRLVDHLKSTEGLDLQYLDFLVIDEADRVLENIQNDWLYHLEKHISPEGASKILNQFALQKHRPPQKLLFSATLSQDPEKLQQLSLFQPKLFTSVVENNDANDGMEHNAVEEVKSDTFIGKYTTPNELTEKYIETSADLKPLMLYKYIQQENLKKTLIFTHSVESTHRLTILLRAMFQNKISVEEISSHLQPKSRVALIDKFSKGEIDLLISTDALARGIDFPGVQCVISYSAPKYLKTYIHRAGRTARAGENGLAVTFLHSSQIGKFKELLQQADKTDVLEIKIPEDDLEPLGEQYKDSLESLRKTVEAEDRQVLNRTKLAKGKKTVSKRNRKKLAVK
ncbi:putative ATP-dependent RNA helicase Dbp73D [Rhynchophorus ferrugineus]|uniref:ATP-dependent RNA helicase n=1 Tax=Rhynchophorus ferrugineus TaxID=354439 RepID=A0A834ISV1_RHYFE|nr:hypothetical protein GWI33_001175 [Rhynchophorus ferrugineus]